MQQNESTITKLKMTIQSVYPDETLQERYINIVYYLNKYGPDIIQKLIDSLDISNFNHKVIETSS